MTSQRRERCINTTSRTITLPDPEGSVDNAMQEGRSSPLGSDGEGVVLDLRLSWSPEVVDGLESRGSGTALPEPSLVQKNEGPRGVVYMRLESKSGQTTEGSVDTPWDERKSFCLFCFAF